MAEFGLRTIDPTGDNSSVSLTLSYGQSAAGTFDAIPTPYRFHTAGAGETITHIGVGAKNNGGADVDFSMAVYEYVPDGDSATFGVMGVRVVLELSPTAIPNDNVWAERLITLTTPFDMVEGTTYIIAIEGDLTTAIIVVDGPERATASSSERDFNAIEYGGLDDPWAGAALVGGRDIAVFAVYTEADAVAPTLTTPYSNQTVTLQDILNIDITTAWSGADGYIINGLTYALEDVNSAIVGMVIDSGVRNFNITAFNSVGTNSDSFYLQVLSGLPNKIKG